MPKTGQLAAPRGALADGRAVSVPALLAGIWGVWYGFTPKGEPLVVRDMGSTDLYALDLDLP